MIYRIVVEYDIDENDWDHLDISLETEYDNIESAMKCYALLLYAHQDNPDVYIHMSSFCEGNPPNAEEGKENPKYIH